MPFCAIWAGGGPKTFAALLKGVCSARCQEQPARAQTQLVQKQERRYCYDSADAKAPHQEGGGSSKGALSASAFKRRWFHSVHLRRSSDFPSVKPSVRSFSLSGLTNLFPRYFAVTTITPAVKRLV